MSYSSHMKRLRATVILKDTPNWGQGIPGLTGDEVCLQLTGGFLSLIDEQDVEQFAVFNWCSHVQKSARVEVARTSPSVGGSRPTIYLHREIMKPTSGQDIDHRDQHKLFCYKVVDNRRSNLRVVTRAHNNVNARKRAACTSIYKGVCWNKQKEAWKSQITVSKRKVFLGYFGSEAEAAVAYNQAHQSNYPAIHEGLNKLSI